MATKAKNLVVCEDCIHFERDTSGPSFSVETGEYFMGTCLIGCSPDSPIKQFANLKHECAKHTIPTKPIKPITQ